MPVKTIIHPLSGQRFKLGRNRPVFDRPKLKFSDYVLPTLPDPPAVCDYRPKAADALKQVYLNDSLGDCVIAWTAKTIGILTGNATGVPKVFSDAQITEAYSQWGGYMPGDESTDNGMDEITALNDWMKSGFIGADKIAGYISIDGSNPKQYRQAIFLFENLMFGMELPDAWIASPPTQSGFVWDAAGVSDPSNGHCFGSGAYHKDININSWGLDGRITDAAIAAYAQNSAGGEIHSVLSNEQLIAATQKAPNGFDWEALFADLKAFGGAQLAA